MAIPDLLWACPRCGRDRGLRPDGRHRFACQGCGTRFERGTSAAIRATHSDGTTETRNAAEWVDRLPPISGLFDGVGEGEPVRAARVETRRVVETDVVRGEDGYLNRIEVFDEPAAGRLVLRPDRLELGPDGFTWPLESLTAVQASSRTLQLKARGAPMVSFRFPDDSIFLWELLIQEALMRAYRAGGLGEIVEFQPRIAVAQGGGR